MDRFTSELSPGIYGLLGPNGAGKSTLMNIIVDNLKPDSGEVLFNGERVSDLGAAYRSRIGYMPQQQGLYDDFTGHRFLWYMAALKGLTKKTARDKIEQLLEVVNLSESRNKKLGSYSGGMKQRILIAQALLNDPDILILDEPTAGLDPRERIRIRNFISEIAQNKIVLLATHVVTDIEYVAKEVLLLRKGKLIFQGKPTQAIEQVNGKVFEVQVKAEELEVIQRQYKISNISGDASGVTVRIVGSAGSEPPQPIGRYMEAVRPNLEDVYLYFFE
ncbi:ATP-binding cassette domain-containing protein [Paenibacillus xylaniclasticus]|uniref:ATP-binding cassette domain-containing protein n=1 Tax=Paenibacillus xylaniclasticus TaxID=588083 RepID=UPI001FE545B8|nr:MULTISPECIES: ATP-binding cassette domain-containing protein [Paenibacillus]